jgi:hypothetical protein
MPPGRDRPQALFASGFVRFQPISDFCIEGE